MNNPTLIAKEEGLDHEIQSRVMMEKRQVPNRYLLNTWLKCRSEMQSLVT